MRTLGHFAVLCVLVMVSACAQMPGGGSSGDDGKYDAAYMKQNLIPGKTTKDQVLAMYGSTSDKSIRSDGSETWNYMYDPNSRAKDVAVNSLWNSIPIPGMAGVAANTFNGEVLNAANPKQARRYLTIHFQRSVLTDYSIHTSK